MDSFLLLQRALCLNRFPEMTENQFKIIEGLHQQAYAIQKPNG